MERPIEGSGCLQICFLIYVFNFANFLVSDECVSFLPSLYPVISYSVLLIIRQRFYPKSTFKRNVKQWQLRNVFTNT